MTREEAIRILKNAAFLATSTSFQSIEEAVKVAIKALEEPQWIPCKERLPNKDGAYLVSGRWASGKESVGDCDYSKEDGYFHTAWNFDVLAWCELPKPYKGEEE